MALILHWIPFQLVWWAFRVSQDMIPRLLPKLTHFSRWNLCPQQALCISPHPPANIFWWLTSQASSLGISGWANSPVSPDEPIFSKAKLPGFEQPISLKFLCSLNRYLNTHYVPGSVLGAGDRGGGWAKLRAVHVEYNLVEVTQSYRSSDNARVPYINRWYEVLGERCGELGEVRSSLTGLYAEGDGKLVNGEEGEGVWCRLTCVSERTKFNPSMPGSSTACLQPSFWIPMSLIPNTM